MSLHCFNISSRRTSSFRPPTDDLFKEMNRLSTFGSVDWNVNLSSIRLAENGFYRLDEEIAECRFCSRAVSERSIAHQHHYICGITNSSETQNVPIRDRSIEDRNGELSLMYLLERKRETKMARNSERYAGGVENWPSGMVQALLNRGYRQDVIENVVKDFFDISGLFPNGKQILLMLQKETRDREYPINLAV